MSHEKLDVGDLVEQLGGFGRFQIYLFLLGCYAAALPGLLVANMYFVAHEPKHRCLVPICECENKTTYEADFLNFSIPISKKGNRDSCSLYNYSSIIHQDELTCSEESFDENSRINCTNFVYDTSVFHSTVITEFDLVCDKAWYIPLVNSAYMVGMLIGAIGLGDLGDRIGRKKGLVVAGGILAIAGILNGLSQNYYMFLITRVVTGMGSVSLFQINFVAAVEFVSKKWRKFVGIMIEIPFAIGESSVAIFAYFIRDWRWIQISTMIPSLLIFLYWWIMPESIRWLVMKKRYQEVIKIIEKIEKVNKIEVPKDYHSILNSNCEIELKENQTDETHHESDSDENERNLLDLFRFPTTRNRTLMLMFCWNAVTLSYYGLSMNSVNFGGNVFVNFVAIMLIEIPSYLSAYFIIDLFGRKGSMILLMLIGGIACLIAAVIPSDFTILIITLSMIGKFGVSAGFAIVYIYTSEIYPTLYRSIGLGSCSMSARIGGILAPLIANLSKTFLPLPFIIFGLVAVASGLLFLFLPETYGNELPQTLAESERFGADQSPLYFTCLSRKKEDKRTSDQ